MEAGLAGRPQHTFCPTARHRPECWLQGKGHAGRAGVRAFATEQDGGDLPGAYLALAVSSLAVCWSALSLSLACERGLAEDGYPAFVLGQPSRPKRAQVAGRAGA